MKAKVKKTEEIIDVEQITEALFRDTARHGIDERIYNESELEFSAPEKTTIEGWVARDSDGSIEIHQKKPTKTKFYWESPKNRPIGESMILPKDSFPDISWNEDEPRKARIEITLIDKKGE